jgi:hypothetical protein
MTAAYSIFAFMKPALAATTECRLFFEHSGPITQMVEFGAQANKEIMRIS